MADDRSGRRAPPAVSSPDSPCLTDFSVAPAIGCQLAEAPGRCRPRAGSARCVSFVARAAAAALCVTVLAFAVTPAKAQTVTIEKISGEESFDSAERATSKFRIRARGSDAPWQGANEHAGITVGVKFDYEGRDLEYWSNSNYTRAPGKKVSSFEVVLARSWQAVGSVPGNRFWDLTEHDMGNHDLHLIGPVIVRLYDPPGGRTYSLGSDTAICLVINESGGTAGEPCSSSQRRSVQVRERLTASFDGLPDSHDGQTAFSFRIQFSEDIDATVDGMRDHALNVSGGTVTGAARVNKRDDLWSFTITPSGDGKVEITLAGGASCTADGAICTSDGRQLSTGLLTIVSGPMPTLSVADVQAYEGVDDHMTFYVSMDRAATERSWVKYATADGTAEAGSDYTAKSGELHFFPGEKVRWKIQVPIIDDTVEDDGEAFTLTLSDPKGVTIGDGVATGTIRNSEEPVEVSVADAEATEGEDRWMRFRLSLNHIAKDVSVDYATADGTATAGVDYVASSGSVVLRKGTIHTYITVPILSDSVEDDGERFTLTLSNVSGAAVADGEAVGTIRDGEPEPGSTVSTVSTVSTGPLWSADMSVVDFGNGSIGAWGADKFSNVGGTEDLGAKWLWYHTGDRKLHLAFTTAIEDTTGLSLYIGDAAVAFPVGGKDSSFSWTDVDIAWADGETVPVRIAQGGSVVTPPANAAPTGLPAISETARVREILTASVDDVADADGLENAVYAYQWIANNGTADADIAGATGATYTPVDGDAGKTLKVRVTFTDDKGTEETLTSVATAAVAATVPSAPVGLAVATGEGRERELTVSWTAPESNGGSEVTGYRVQWKSGTEAWDGSETSTRQAALGDPAAASHTIAELANGTAYTVRVVATNAAGDGEAAEVTATAQDRLAPVLTAASVNGTALTLTFSEALDAVSKAAADAFAISVEGTARTVDAVALSGSAATLTLASGVASGETVTMGYTVPTGDDATPLQDAAGNAVAAYSGHAVTNETPAAANTDPTGLPAITGTPQVSDTLTASISDIDDGDGLDNAIFAYQWLANDGTDDTEIADATGATHEVAPAQVGKTLKVRVTFTDDASTEETLTSAATEAVAARAPDAPGGLTVAAAVERASELNVSWTAPASDGGAEVTGYKVQWKSGAESYDGSDTSTRQALVSDPAVLTHTITGLTVGTAYTVRVLAVNTAGDGAPAEAAATTENRVAATISSVAISSDTGDGNSIGDDDGVYGIDDAIQITVTFDQAVIVTGAPELELDIGSKAAPATYASSAGNEVVFSYTVAEGDADTDGIAIGANKLALDGGSIKDASDNDANLAHASLAAQSGHLVDGVRPTIAQAGLHGSNGGVDNVYVLGELVGAYLQFTEAVTVNGSPELTLDFESGPKAIPLSVLISCGSPPSVSALTLTLTRCEKSQHQGTSLIFSHTVVRGDEDTDGPGVGANALTLNGATIADLAGNAAVLTHAAVAENTDYIIDGIPPAITSVEIVSDPGDDDTYGVGDVIRILIKFDDRVYVYWHAPRLRLDVGGKTRMAYRTRTTWEDISEGEDGKVLAFTYTVAAGDNDDNGIAIGANALQLGWGELKEADSLSRNDADITHAAVSDDAGHKVSTPAGNTATDDDAAPKSGLLTITGTVKVGNTVSADTSNLTDEDGLAYATYTYSWFVEGGRGSYETTNPGFTIAAAHEGKRLQASVLFFDDNGNREERSSAYTQPVKPRGWSNSAPTGAPAITGTPQVGETLTASISDIEDADGLDNATFAYQWLAHDGTDDSEIAGATGSTHEVAPAEVGKTLKVRVTFTDDVGTEETLTSVATEAVAARAPDAPGGLTVAAAAGRAGELDVSWTAPASDGGSEVTGYKVQWKSGAESYDGSDTSTRQALVSDPAVLTHTITGLTVGTAYTVRVLAVNAAGDGAAVEVEATVQDRVHPTLSAASVNGTALTLTFSEALDVDSKPAADAFTVTVAGNVRDGGCGGGLGERG